MIYNTLSRKTLRYLVFSVAFYGFEILIFNFYNKNYAKFFSKSSYRETKCTSNYKFRLNIYIKQ